MTLITSAMLRGEAGEAGEEKAAPKKPPKGTIGNPTPGIDPYTGRPYPKNPPDGMSMPKPKKPAKRPKPQRHSS